MSIINEQNILGNPDLATATRPGSDITIADYSFGTMSGLYEKIVHEAMGLARGGDWTQPTPYSGEVAQAEVEKESSDQETGPAGDLTQSMPTQYGNQSMAPLTENSTMKTKNTQVASVLAKDVEPTGSMVNSTSTAVRSDLNKVEGIQGPVASGGQFNGYESTNPYYGNPNANDGRGTSTMPMPIENTGVKPYVVPDLSGGRPSSSDNDDPMPGRAGKKKVGKKKKSNKRKTSGQSAARFPDTSGGPRYRVHKSRNALDRPGMESGGAKPTAQEGLDMGAAFF